MKEIAKNDVAIMAVGGISTLGDATAMFDAGAARIGTTSGVHIINSLPL